MAVESICLRCLNPAHGWTKPVLGFRCVDCWRLMLGNDEVDDIILNEHIELVDGPLLDRVFWETV